MNLEHDAMKLINQGVYDPHILFKILYNKHPVHYSRVREAIHAAKQR
jgi:hypothetical protein